MRAKIVSILGIVLLMAASAASAERVVAPITSVVLYPGSATVTRTAHVEAGSTQLVIPDVTSNFAIPTLRVESDPGIRIGQIVTQDAGRTESANPAEANLEAKIQTLKDQAAALDAEAGAADIVKMYLERIGGDSTSANDRPRAAMDAKTLAGVIDAIGRGANDALGKKQRVGVQKREIEKKIDAFQRDLNRLRSDSKDSRTVTIHLNADHAGSIRLSYQVNSAGWKPSYRVELNSASSTVNLERLAQVSQKTGEDWKDVKISLSTSQPRLSPVATSPQPWLLAYVPPSSVHVSSGEFARFSAPAPAPAMVSALAKREDTPAYVPPTFQTDGSFATEFEVPARVTIPADGRDITLGLAKQTVVVKQRLQVTPRIDKAATVTAEAERPSGVWLSGNMQIYRDGNYVGAANWHPQASNKFSFSFGRDDLLRVTLDQAKDNAGSIGIFEKRNQRKIADLITVKSMHASPIAVLIIEATPVSTSDEIKIQATFEPKPSIEAWEQRRGVIAWEKMLSPNETAKFGVSYTIDYPKEGAVTGLY
jgi:uncharacterized protein (TIGR02231 family)